MRPWAQDDAAEQRVASSYGPGCRIRDTQLRRLPCALVRRHHDLNILTEGDQEAEQPFDGELPKIAAQHVGNVWLRHAEQLCGRDLLEPPGLHEAADLGDKLSLDEV